MIEERLDRKKINNLETLSLYRSVILNFTIRKCGFVSKASKTTFISTCRFLIIFVVDCRKLVNVVDVD